MATVGITKEAIQEKPEVILEAIRRLKATADFRNPGPVTLELCPGQSAHGNVVLTAEQERCFIHLSQEEWRK